MGDEYYSIICSENKSAEVEMEGDWSIVRVQGHQYF